MSEAAVMGDWRQCSRCGDYGWTGTHRCAPLYECRIEAVGGRAWGDGDWRVTHARDPEEAAEKFCDRYDARGDYPIISAGEAVILVRRKRYPSRPGAPVFVQWRQRVRAETVRSYYASGSAELLDAAE